MAIDPRISLTPAPTVNVGQRFGQAISNLQNIDLMNKRRDMAPIQLEQAQRANELGIAQQPALLQQAESAASGESQLINQQQQAQQIATSYAAALRPLLSNPQALVSELQKQKIQFQSQGVPTDGIDEDILQAQTPQGLLMLSDEINTVLTQIPQQQRVTASKILDDGTTIQSLSTGGTNVVSPQGDVLTGNDRKIALDKALKTKVSQKGDIAQAISDVAVDEAIRLEKETETGRQEVELKQINIDETKIKNTEKKKQAIDSKNSRRAEADNASLVVDELLSDDSFSSAFGRFNNAPPEGLRTQANIDARAKVDQVVGLLSLESRQKLKGQGTITDSEAKTLEKSATVLTNPLISDNVARKELRRVKRIFEDASDRNQLKQETLQQQSQSTASGFKILSIK